MSFGLWNKKADLMLLLSIALGSECVRQLDGIVVLDQLYSRVNFWPQSGRTRAFELLNILQQGV
jgi:hypothetical protein